ncbi:DUF58 domain-containing protein [Rhodopirellula sp. SWK7]|uniref:DUF58 domain-containing protein n=1 Tax=Rhodopirellula sp. SWK7 TaxID=595460 RepID=UPI0002BFE546|nr:DUF58 domain-containing protein [Rhodopirellula sp. SWK7]EMI40605.1 protein containing DUF58 [Rhodopirellula sp. SWK7]
MKFLRRFQSKPKIPRKELAIPADPSAALGQLELLSRNAVDGLLSGKHRSTHRGGTSDFAEHREYSFGDDVRRIDWRLHARNDRYHVRTYEDETNLKALLVVDASGSMRYEGAAASKFDVARSVTACLARLMMRQRDSVGLAVIDESVRVEVPAGLRPSTLMRINQTLADATIAGGSNVPGCLTALRPAARRRGMMVLISDCFGDPEKLRISLSTWSAAGHDCVVVELLAPEEIEFTFRGTVVFDDLEMEGSRLEMDAGQIRQVYLERFNKHRQQVAEAIRRSRADHLTLRADAPIAETLRQFLIRRTAKARARAGGGRR